MAQSCQNRGRRAASQQAVLSGADRCLRAKAIIARSGGLVRLLWRWLAVPISLAPSEHRSR